MDSIWNAAIEKAAEECDRHAAWLKEEAHAGGNWEHLIARADEAAYNAKRIRALKKKVSVEAVCSLRANFTVPEPE